MENQGLYLQHYGVLGMKWGRRKRSGGSFSERGRARQKQSDERDEERRKKNAERIKSFKKAGEAHQQKTDARDAARRKKNAERIESFKKAGQTHQQKTDARDASRREKVAKAGKKITEKYKASVAAKTAANKEAQDTLGKDYKKAVFLVGKSGARRISRAMLQKGKTFKQAATLETGKTIAGATLANVGLQLAVPYIRKKIAGV